MSENAPMDIRQFAAHLQINEATVCSWAQKGKLPGIKRGRIWPSIGGHRVSRSWPDIGQ